MLQRILAHKIPGLFVFFLVMALIFHLTFNVAGKELSALLADLIDAATECISNQLLAAGASPALHALIVEGICAGVGSVLSFIPVIAVLFFLLSLLTESGYLAQVSILLDRPFRCIGLSGEAAVPMIMGFGCAVPAILAAGTLSSKRERYLTMLLIPFMSCSAKLPIYGALAGVFFSQHRMTAIIAIYATGILAAALCCATLNRLLHISLHTASHPSASSRTMPRQAASRRTLCRHAAVCHASCRRSGSSAAAQDRPAAKTLPALHLPSLKKVMRPVINSCLGFIRKAFTIIFAASIIIWFLQNFNMHLHMTTDIEDSILAFLGKSAAPFFTPLGFGDWRAASALIAGVSAKEAALSTLAILSNAAGGASLATLLTEIFTPLSAFSFMVFCLLYVPCIATLTVIRKETGRISISLLMLFGQTAIAWLVSFLLFHIGSFII